MSETSEPARLWMLEVVSCDEQLGDDGMCDCAREHFEQLAAKDAEIEQLRAEVVTRKKITTELIETNDDLMAGNEQLRAELERFKDAAKDVLARYGRRDPATQLPPVPGKDAPKRVPALENLEALM